MDLFCLRGDASYHLALAWAGRADLTAFTEWTSQYLVVVRRLAAAAGAAAKRFVANLTLNQKLICKITKVPPSIAMAPAPSGRLDTYSLLLDAVLDWRRTWTRDSGIAGVGCSTVGLCTSLYHRR